MFCTSTRLLKTLSSHPEMSLQKTRMSVKKNNIYYILHLHYNAVISFILSQKNCSKKEPTVNIQNITPMFVKQIKVGSVAKRVRRCF